MSASSTMDIGHGHTVKSITALLCNKIDFFLLNGNFYLILNLFFILKNVPFLCTKHSME